MCSVHLTNAAMPSQVPTSFASAAAAGTSQDWGARGGRADGGGVMDWWVDGKSGLCIYRPELDSGSRKPGRRLSREKDDEDSSVALEI